MRVRSAWIALSTLLLVAGTAFAGVSTPHLISFQGRALDSAGNVVLSGDLAVRIYDAASGGTSVYDSGSDFDGVIQDGFFSVLLGEFTSLSLDNTQSYFLEVDINGEEVVGDAVSGRQEFYPGGGSHERTDLENRLTALEDIVFFSCSPGTFDLNSNPGDGCEFTLDTDGIYVSESDGFASDVGLCGLGPTGTGVGNFPCASITRGIARAVETGRSTIYVADGNYVEYVSLVDGKSLKGGYRSDTWERHLATTNTILRGSTPSGHKKTVIADGVTSTTTVEGFVIYGADNFAASGNSYAVHVVNSPGLRLLTNFIYAGDGGDGSAGNDGPAGASGVNGSNGLDAKETTSNCFEQCGPAEENAGGSGGALSCAGTNVSGGDGAKASCPDYDATTNLCSACPAGGANQPTRDNGQSGFNGGGAGGAGGWDALLDYTCNGNQCICRVDGGPIDGSDGADGPSGSDGPGGTGAADNTGSVSNGDWIGFGGAGGSDGASGSGGGGGGAGGGVETFLNANCSSAGQSDVGGSGGGGGSGGCKGTAGTGGSAGGGSFAIFVHFSFTPASVPEISGNTIQRGGGGDGGRGGNGGPGGIGGAGGVGGGGGASPATFCAGEGGVGGEGGNGGHGGGGGGGAGGVSFGIHATGHGGLDLSAWASNNAFPAGGAGGTGGSGGASVGSSGAPGVAGNSGNTNF